MYYKSYGVRGDCLVLIHGGGSFAAQQFMDRSS